MWLLLGKPYLAYIFKRKNTSVVYASICVYFLYAYVLKQYDIHSAYIRYTKYEVRYTKYAVRSTNSKSMKYDTRSMIYKVRGTKYAALHIFRIKAELYKSYRYKCILLILCINPIKPGGLFVPSAFSFVDKF